MIGSADKGGYRFASAPQFSRPRSDADNWVIVAGAGDRPPELRQPHRRDKILAPTAGLLRGASASRGRTPQVFLLDQRSWVRASRHEHDYASSEHLFPNLLAPANRRGRIGVVRVVGRIVPVAVHLQTSTGGKLQRPREAITGLPGIVEAG